MIESETLIFFRLMSLKMIEKIYSKSFVFKKKLNCFVKHHSSILAGLFCVTMTGIGFGISLPLLSLMMKKMGYSSFLIGLNTSMPALAAVLLAPVFLKLMHRFGLRDFICFCALIAMGTFLSFYLTQIILMWFILRFIFGACLDGIFVASETWVAELSSHQMRGRMMGVFSSCLSVGYFIGAGVLTCTGSEGLLPFVVGSIFFCFVLVSVFFKKKTLSMSSQKAVPFTSLIFSNPIAMGAAFVYGYLETTAFNMLPLYGISQGLEEKASLTLLMAVALGQACLQYFIGTVADFYGEKRALFLCVFFCFLGALGIRFFIETKFLIHFILFFWGACINGFYTLALMTVGKKYKGHELAGANAAIVSLFGLGSLLGPFCAGVSMNLFKTNGFFLSLLFPVCAYFFQLKKREDKIFLKSQG